jgi:hypothetical protein
LRGSATSEGRLKTELHLHVVHAVGQVAKIVEGDDLPGAALGRREADCGDMDTAATSSDEIAGQAPEIESTVVLHLKDYGDDSTAGLLDAEISGCFSRSTSTISFSMVYPLPVNCCFISVPLYF